MKINRKASAAGAIMLFGTMILAYAQDQQSEKQSKGDKREKAGQPQRTQQQALAWQEQQGWVQQGGGWQRHETWQQGRASRWQSEHRNWAQRGGYGGSYIPEAAFGLHFGRQHSFRILSRPAMYLGYPRFEYGGFSFLMVDPWPEYWADNWYAFDDVYVDYDDGYYLYNPSYPQVKLAIAVAL